MQSGNAVRLLRLVAMKLWVSDTHCHAVAACVVKWVRGSNAAKVKDFSVVRNVQTGSGLTQTAVEWVQGVVPRE